MKVYFVGAGPGDPDLLTHKARRLLCAARLCVYAGSLVNPAILELLPPEAERYDSAAMSLDQIVGLFEAAHARRVDVVRLHTGEPSIYGAIGEQMDALDRLGIDYEIVPGISAFQAAAAALRVELTAPEIAQTIILTAHSRPHADASSGKPCPPGPIPCHFMHLPLGGPHRRVDGHAGRALRARLSGRLGIPCLLA